MSTLPPAPQDVSVHPKKGSVVAPVDRGVKERDVDRNIRLFTILTALREGKLPSNAQLSKTLRHLLDTTLSTSTVTSPSSRTTTTTTHRLSPAGKTLVQDTRGIIESLRLILDEKNADELVQDFIFGLSDVQTGDLKRTLIGLDSDTDADSDFAHTGQQQMDDEPVKHLRTLLKLLFSNAELRKLVGDFSIIGRDILARSAEAAAKRVAPRPDELEGVDRPVEGGGEERFVRGGVGDVSGEEGVGGEKGKKTIKGVMGKMRDTVKGGADTTKTGDVGLDAGETLESGKRFLSENDGGENDVGEKGKKTLKGVMGKMRDTVKGGKPNEVANDTGASETLERGKKLLSEEYFPKERREQFLFRGKKVILELQNHDDYQASIRWLINYVQDSITHAVNNGGERVKHSTANANLTTSLTQLRTILERFANNTSMDLIFDAVRALVDDARRDDALWTWWSSVGLWIKKVLLEPGYILSEECTSHATRLRDLGREFYDAGKYRMHFDAFFESVGQWVGGFGDDPVNKQFGGDWARLTKDLLFDSEGSLKFKPELWDDIRRVIVPAIIEQAGYIPIPRIEYSDDALDLVIENLTLQGRNLFPNLISFDMNNHIRFSPYNSMYSSSSAGGGGASHEYECDAMTNRHRIKIHLEQMQADMRDVAFYYRKKKGIPKMRDSGVADVVVGGKGLSILIDLVSSPAHDTTSTFHIQSIKTKLDSRSLKFAIRNSNHDFLYKTLRPLATGLIKKQVEKAVGEGVRVGLVYLDGRVSEVREGMRRVKEEGGGKEGVLRDIFERGKNAAAANAETQHDPSSAMHAGVGEAKGAVQEHVSNVGRVSTNTSHSSTGSLGSSSGGSKAKSKHSQFKIGGFGGGDKRESMGGASVRTGTRTGTRGWMSDAF